MQAHVYDETAVQETALLLTSLSKSTSTIPALMSVAVQPCMKALEVHQNETSVADALAGFLAQMPIEDDQNLEQALATSLLDKADLLSSRSEVVRGSPLA